MESLPFNNFNMEDTKPILNVNEMLSVSAAANSPQDTSLPSKAADGVFSPLAPSFQSRIGNEYHNLLGHQEPRHADKAPSTAEMDDVLLNYRMNAAENIFEELEANSQNYYTGTNNTESVGSSNNMWNDNSSMSAGPNEGVFDTVDFLVKSLSSANYYVSMLTREQVAVMRSIRPSLLYELLLEVAKVRNDKRQRRALPNECAFCKNNGEIEECYTSHALKDWRGRVLCPVLRAFRCPRCGATGDRAHTIKYCQENAEASSGHSLGARRRIPPSLLLGGRSSAPPVPTPSPTTTPLTHPSIWSTFGMN